MARCTLVHIACMLYHENFVLEKITYIQTTTKVGVYRYHSPFNRDHFPRTNDSLPRYPIPLRHPRPLNRMHGKGCYTDSEKSRWEGEFFNGMYDNGRAKVALR